MAPSCNWMIKIVKVDKLYLNSLLLSFVYPCLSKRNKETSMRVKTSTCQTRNVFLHSLPCSARSFSDIPAMKKSSADQTHLVSSGGRLETGAIHVFHTVSRPQGLSCVISELTETPELWGKLHSEIRFVIHGMQEFLGASPTPLTICGQLFHLVSFSDEIIIYLNQMLIYWETITMFDQWESSSRYCGLTLIPKIGGILKNSFNTLLTA